MKKDRLCKIFIQLIIIAFIFTGVDLFAEDKNNPKIVPYVDNQDIDSCAGRGLYRPLEWYRQIKLGVAYLLNRLKEKEVVQAYPLQDVMESFAPKIQSGEIEHIGVLIPSNDELILTIVPIRCLQENELDATIYELKINPQLSDTLTSLSEWPQSLDEGSLEKLYIISEWFKEADDEDKWVSWDSSEPVELEVF